MDLGIVFAPVVKHVEVVHPAGAKFRLYPQSSKEAWDVIARHTPLKHLEQQFLYEEAVQKAALSGGEKPLMSKFYSTADEMLSMQRNILAAHIADWSDLDLHGQPLPHSFETACKLINDFPAFAEWVRVETQRLGEEAAEKARLAEAVSGN